MHGLLTKHFADPAIPDEFPYQRNLFQFRKEESHLEIAAQKSKTGRTFNITESIELNNGCFLGSNGQNFN